MMRKPLPRLLALIAAICLAPLFCLADTACSWEASLHISLTSGRRDLSAVIELLNALSASGTWVEQDGAFDLNASVGFRDSEARAAFTLGGVASHWQLTSPLLGDQALMFNNPAMIEYGNKIRNHLGIPLQWAALLYPYAWENALEAPAAAIRETFGTETGDRIVPAEDLTALAETLADLAENDRAFSHLLSALSFGDEGWSAADTFSEYIWEVPGLIETFAPDGVLVRVTGSGEKLSLLGGRITQPILVREGGHLTFTVPDVFMGLGLVRFDGKLNEDGTGHALLTIGDDGAVLRAEAALTADRFAFSLSGSALSELRLPVFSSGGYGKTLFERKPLGDGVFAVEIRAQDGCYTLSDTASGCEIASLFLTLQPMEPARRPDWTAEKVKGINFYSLDDSTLADLVRNAAEPMIKGLIPLVAAAPTSSVTALMDWLEDSGLLTGR